MKGERPNSCFMPYLIHISRTNSQNDAILYKLVHTKLLSGSASTELDLTPAQRKKALVGRVMELAGDSSLGKGEKAVREAERNKAAKNVREGMLMKQKEREKRHLDEVRQYPADRVGFGGVHLITGKRLGKLSPDLEEALRVDIIFSARTAPTREGPENGRGQLPWRCVETQSG